MTLTTISIIAATAIYLAYNAICLALFSIPESLSDTYYLWKEKNGKGWLFCLMMYLVVAFMMPAWITLSEGSNFQFLSFLAPASIAFVGLAPKFKDADLEKLVHTLSAIVAAVASMVWVVLVTPYWAAITVFSVIYLIKACWTKTYRSGRIYWLEQIAFCSTFTAAILYSFC